jgi:arabinose-5-phosphate isomerase
MTAKGLGMTAVVDAQNRITGVFTDGDLRRSLTRVVDATTVRVADLMTKSPRTIGAARLAADCIVLMETPPKITVLLVAGDAGELVGAVQMHDLFRARVL